MIVPGKHDDQQTEARCDRGTARGQKVQVPQQRLAPEPADAGAGIGHQRRWRPVMRRILERYRDKEDRECVHGVGAAIREEGDAGAGQLVEEPTQCRPEQRGDVVRHAALRDGRRIVLGWHNTAKCREARQVSEDESCAFGCGCNVEQGNR